ncbi:hypothetical protein ACXET9_12610 [Brachybacterium sp. DNPG3]
MKAPTRLAVYGAGLVVAFGGAFGLAGVVIPESVVTAWAASSAASSHDEGDVAGHAASVESPESRTDEVDGYTVALEGELTAGSPSDLTVTVERDGEPVTALEPYLGAFGHLVALREDDLAYLRIHPTGDAPAAGETGGPEIGFRTEAPTAGRYLLHLDFQVDGEVRTAQFAVDAASTGEDTQ